jgi:DNA-binding response OmpR family regulator
VRILVVEDEPAIADFVVRGLQAEGYAVDSVADGLDGERRATTEDVDLVILDRMLPGKDGLDVLRAIRRARPALPVIVLSARGEVADRVEGLDGGADDYLAKPFSFDELVARVRARVRAPAQADPTVLEAAGIRVELLTRRVQRAGREIALSAKEFELLAYFMRHPGQVLSREQILSAVWGYDFDPGTNVVQVYVGYLRRKLGPPSPILTLRGAGFRLVDA